MRTILMALCFSVVSTFALADGKGDWPMYGANLERSFSNPASGLKPSNVAALTLAWRFPTEDAVTAAPTVVGNAVYVGAWDGYFYAISAPKGVLLWRFAIDCQNSVTPVPARCLAPGQTPPDRSDSDGGLITASAAVEEDRIYFAGGRTMYCLRARDGKLLWKRIVCGNPDDPQCESDQNDGSRVFSSPAVHDGLVFIGSSTDGQDGYRGGILALDAKNGAIRWRFEVDPILDANGHVILNGDGLPAGGYNRGCGNVWASVSVDPDRHRVFVGTADCDHAALPPYHNRMLALHERTGRLQWVFSPIPADVCDLDFGATANVIGRDDDRLLGFGGKNGHYYLIDRRSGKQVWDTQVVPGGNAGGFFGGAAVTGSVVVSATSYGDQFMIPGCPFDPFQEPSLHALDLATGDKVWELPGNQSYGATTAGDGVVFVSYINLLGPPTSELHAYDARTGALLFNTAVSVSLGPPTPARRGVFLGTGDIRTGDGGGINAYRLP